MRMKLHSSITEQYMCLQVIFAAKATSFRLITFVGRFQTVFLQNKGSKIILNLNCAHLEDLCQ